MARVTRKFRPHPQLLMDVIRRQAGTLSKAILEATMNAVDAKAKRCEITITRERVTIIDDGHGFKDNAEVENFFEVFGQPHEEGDAVYGKFRMGRGQLFSFGQNAWRSNAVSMKVDVKRDGLDYQFEDELPMAPGCAITIDLYEPLTNAGLHDTVREFGQFAAYVSIPVIVNNTQVSRLPTDEKWDFETEEGYFKLGSGSLRVYNLGVLVREFHSGHYGTGGIVVSKKPLEVNFARNDVMGTCKVWRRLKDFVRRQAEDVMKSKPLDDVGRQRLAERFHEEKVYHELRDRKIITDVSGKHHCVEHLIMQERICVAPDHDRVGDYIMQTGQAFVLAKSTLERFDVRTMRALLNLLLAAGASDYMISRLKIVSFEELAKAAGGAYRLLPDKQWRPKERLWIRLAERFSYLSWKNSMVLCRNGESIEMPKREMEGRDIHVGTSNDANGWTDGDSYIAIDRRYLARLNPSKLSDLFEYGRLLLHEYCHNEADTGTDVHGPEFDAAFRERVGMIGLFVEWAMTEIPKQAERATKTAAKAKDRMERLAKAEATLAAAEVAADTKH